MRFPASWAGACGKIIYFPLTGKTIARSLRHGLILLPARRHARRRPHHIELQSACSVCRRRGPEAVRDDFILRVDARSGCVWRVSVATGRHEFDPLPYKRPKGTGRIQIVQSKPEILWAEAWAKDRSSRKN